MSKIWFITGASRGIGKMIVQAALACGDKVVATGRNAEDLHQAFGQAGGALLVAEVNVQVEEQVALAVKQAISHFGGIDVLVNNAGYGQLGPFETISAHAILEQFTTNVFGLMNTTRAVLPHMRAAHSGHIFNLSSIGGTLGFDGASIYCSSKFAVEGYSESLALELEKFNINVTIVEPGFFRTDFLDSSSVKYGDQMIPAYERQASQQESTYEQYNHAQPGDPKKLSAAIVKLAHTTSPPLRFVAGSDALEMSQNALSERIKELAQWEELSMAMQYETTQ